MPTILKRVSVEVQEKVAEDLLATDGLWLECPVRLTPARLSNDRPDYASRVMQISKPGSYQVVVKNGRADPIAVVVWVAMPSSLAAASASRSGGQLGQHGTPAPTCPMVHIVSPGQEHTVKGIAAHSRCCQAGGVQRFTVPASQLSAQHFQKLKVAAYPVKRGAAGVAGACSIVEEGAQSGTLTGTVPLAQFSLYVGRIGDATASTAPPAAMADPSRLPPPPPARQAGEVAVAKNTLRGMAVYDFSKDSDDEAAGGALPAITRGLNMNVCANDGQFRTRTVPVDLVDVTASVLLEVRGGAGGSSSSGWGAPVMEDMDSASDTAATTQPVHELESDARAASATLRPAERHMTADEEQSFAAFVRRAVTACALDLPAPTPSAGAALAGIKRVRDGGSRGEEGDSEARTAMAAGDAPSTLAPSVLLWDIDGNPLCSLRGVTAARDGCVVVSVTPGDTFVPLDVVGTQLAVEEL